jgi:bacterial/archaeal transporter family-2 protein
MDPTFAVALMLFAGAQLALQPPVNAGLARATGSLAAVLISFAGGTLLLIAVAVAGGTIGDLGRIGDAEWYHLLGGLSGALFVLTAAAVVPRIGAGAVAAGTITGQLTGSLVVDALGILGLEGRPVTAARVLGAAALVAGTCLIAVRRRGGSPPAVGRGGLVAPLLAMTAVGALLSLQHPVNARLADSIGGVPSALTNFVVGTLVLAVAVALSGSAGRLRDAAKARPAYLAGGLFGVVVVLASLSTVDEIGAGAVAAATATGQLVASIALDRVGFLGLERKPVGATRIAGVALLALGTFLIVG